MSDPPETAAVRDASRQLVRELGFMKGSLAGTELSASAVHTLIEIGSRGAATASELGETLLLDKSSVSRLVAKLIAGGELAAGPHEGDGRSKRLILTPKGRRSLRAIDAFARAQVAEALAPLPGPTRRGIAEGLRAYADALAARRGGGAADAAVAVARGYRTGLLGRVVDIHARYYEREAGFGRVFEAKVAGGMAAFLERLDAPANEIWSASFGGTIVGAIAIDGEDLGPGRAHLRWFIVEEGLRGGGIGRRLLAEALRFCDARGYAETHLWTFRGLDAARRLYEAHGFALVEEQPGRQWGAEVMEQRFMRRHPEAPV